jgi:hypothetical protein
MANDASLTFFVTIRLKPFQISLEKDKGDLVDSIL